MWVEAVRAEQQKGEVRSSSSSSADSISHPCLITLPPHHPSFRPSSQERYAEAVKEHEEMIERR